MKRLFIFQLHQDAGFRRNDIPVQDMNTVESDIQQWVVKFVFPHMEILVQDIIIMILFGLIIIRIEINEQGIGARVIAGCRYCTSIVKYLPTSAFLFGISMT